MTLPLPRFTAFLDEIGLDDLGEAGGKGANLGYLLRAGFPVPPGFCVLARAWDSFLNSHDLGKRLRSEAEGIDFENLGEVEAHAAALREMILSTPIPGAIEEEITASYERLLSASGGADLVAVRSSAVSRDLSFSSFPGQMDTYHNLRGEGIIVEKVRECWASLFSYAAVAYRHARGIGQLDVLIAPLVQAMIDPDCAGVIFTADPLEGRPDCMVINSCFGLGEGVVSGVLECDHFVVDRNSAAVLEERPGNKEFKIVLDAARGEGNARIPLEDEERLRPSLDATRIRELVGAARNIEALYGAPQDIEWAFGGGELFILQSRTMMGPGEDHPGTAGGEEWICEFDSVVDPDYPLYTLSNISEVLPGVLTPLSISDIDTLDYGLVKCNSDLGLMKGIHPRSDFTFLGIFYGRAHLNLSVYKAVISKLPGATTEEFDRRAPEDIGEDDVEGWRPTPGNILALPGIIARTIYRAAATPRQAEILGREYGQKLLRFRGMDYQAMPFPEIFAILEEIRQDLFGAMATHLCVSQFAVIYYDLLSKATSRWLGDGEGVLAARLVTGLRDIESALPSVPIWDLSRMVVASSILREIFEGNPPHGIGDSLERSTSPEAKAFLEALDSFLERFGYRGIFESEAMLPNWEQDPSYIFSVIHNYLDADPGYNPRDIATRQKKEREEAVREAMKDLKRLRKSMLSYLVKQAQTYIMLREKVKALIVKGLAHAKMVFRIVGRRLAEQGLVRKAEDIYFLTHREIEALATGHGEGLAVDTLVPRRRLEYGRNLAVVLPEYSRGRPAPLTTGELESPRGVEVLHGTGVSPGRITGTARVITDPLDNAEIKPGEILVAPVTDAAWTPLFVTAAATVVDVGGPLSHGSIVAREFGIPCVVNVGNATSLIRSGQVITVDGSKGRVFLHAMKEGAERRGKI